MISTTADATHFVNCRGLIEMQDCLFENQLGRCDKMCMASTAALHRSYLPSKSISSGFIPSIRGWTSSLPAIFFEFVGKETLLTNHQSAVTEVERINSQFCRVGLASALPPQVKSGDAAASLTAVADVTIRACTTRGNRARGFLLSSPGRILVEDCHLHAPGDAILIAGDAGTWFESGGVRDVTIRGNHFDNCNYGVWGAACIEIGPEIEPAHRSCIGYHQNIVIEGNTFRCFRPTPAAGVLCKRPEIPGQHHPPFHGLSHAGPSR